MPHRYFIRLSFKGANYHGWQVQENAHTVQKELDNALSNVFSERITTTGCGRTDTGVHATEFYAHFDSNNKNLEKELSSQSLHPSSFVIFKLNNCLPDDIAIQQIINVSNKAHARFDAISRTYQYFINRKKDPFIKDRAYYFYGDLDVDLMNSAAMVLFDHGDFSCFSKSGTQVKTNDCEITRAEWVSSGLEHGAWGMGRNFELLVFTITANRFLRGMVRAIVGTMIEIGRKKMTIDEFRKIIEGRKRSDAGYSVPACGLYLTKVMYPKEIL
ncbi:MAG: tRNA pseudouridine(38-40) synthase TruA [Bacteroidota bacterium]